MMRHRKPGQASPLKALLLLPMLLLLLLLLLPSYTATVYQPSWTQNIETRMRLWQISTFVSKAKNHEWREEQACHSHWLDLA